MNIGESIERMYSIKQKKRNFLFPISHLSLLFIMQKNKMNQVILEVTARIAERSKETRVNY
jgi:hypothetical protein